MSDELKRHPNEERFEDFFHEPKYVALKNYLYNYQCRRRAIGEVLAECRPSMILEVGSGLSPIVLDTDHIVYSELSYQAIQTLKKQHGRGNYVVADGTRLPFRDGAFPCAVCSEVLEHVEDDQKAIQELGRVIRDDGTVIITVPHGKFYFAADDRFVSHFRRYTIEEMREKLSQAGLKLSETRKVLGPLEKAVMWSCVMAFRLIQVAGGGDRTTTGSGKPPFWMELAMPFWRLFNAVLTPLARFDAFIMPRSISTVILFRAHR